MPIVIVGFIFQHNISLVNKQCTIIIVLRYAGVNDVNPADVIAVVVDVAPTDDLFFSRDNVYIDPTPFNRGLAVLYNCFAYTTTPIQINDDDTIVIIIYRNTHRWRFCQPVGNPTPRTM